MNRRIGSIVICLVLVQFKYIAHNEPAYKESRNPIMTDTLKKKKRAVPICCYVTRFLRPQSKIFNWEIERQIHIRLWTTSAGLHIVQR